MTDPKKSFEDGLDTIKTLTGLSQADFDTLKGVAGEALTWTPDIVKAFYETLFAHARTAKVFHEGERPAREATLEQWYRSVFEANNDEAFWKAQARIGFAHIRRRVNNEFMIGMATQVSQLFSAKAVEKFGAERGLEAARAFERVLSGVVGLTAEGYDVMSQIAFSESTGADPELVNRLIQESVNEVQKKLG